MRRALGGGRRAAAVVAALCLVATGVAPQVASAAASCPGNAVGRVVGDVDGDRRPDVVVGVPHLTGRDGADHAGALDLHLTSADPQRLTLDRLGEEGRAGRGARLGASVELGPYFDEDGCSDVAAGAPGLDDGRGAVFVLHGSAQGVVGADAVKLVAPDGAAGDHFGASVALGEGDDGVHLWVGAPGRRVAGLARAGQVYDYLVGPDFGLTLVGTLSYATPGVAGAPRAGDRFGQVLNGWGSAVMVGVPRRKVHGEARAGEVVWASRGLDERPTFTARVVNQDSPSVPGRAERGDRFGAALADGLLDWVGVPGEDLGDVTDAGLVHAGFTLDDQGRLGGGRVLTQRTPGVPGRVERGDRFGAALATVEGMTCARTRSLAIGAPGESLGVVGGVGSVTLVDEQLGQGEPAASSGCDRVRVLSQRTSVPGRLAAGNHLGARLAGLDVNAVGTTSSRSSLVIGVPGQDRQVRDAGLVVFLPQLGAAEVRRSIGGDVRGLSYGSVLAQLR